MHDAVLRESIEIGTLRVESRDRMHRRHCIGQHDGAHLFQGIFPVLFVFLPAVYNVETGINGCQEGRAVRLVLAGDIECRPMIGGCPYHG